MIDLLPVNATAHERALSLATARAANVQSSSIRNHWNPALCSSESLPWLAWAFSVAPWNPDWTDAQKRVAISASINVHRVRGTIGGLRHALAALGYEVNIVENSGAPFVFDINITRSTETTDNAQIISYATEIALKAKNARSKLGTVSLGLTQQADVFFGAITVLGVEVTVMPEDYQFGLIRPGLI